MFLKRTVNVGLHEAVEVEDGKGNVRLGRISAIDDDSLTIEVLESTAGLGLDDTRVRFRGEPLTFEVGPELLGRIFDGVGRVIDDGPPVPAEKALRIDGLSIIGQMRDGGVKTPVMAGPRATTQAPVASKAVIPSARMASSFMAQYAGMQSRIAMTSAACSARQRAWWVNGVMLDGSTKR